MVFLEDLSRRKVGEGVVARVDSIVQNRPVTSSEDLPEINKLEPGLGFP